MGHMTQGMGGLLGRGVQMRLSDIVDVAMSYPRFGVSGYIRFLTGGEGPITVQEAVKNESCVIFKKRHQAAFDTFRQELKALLAQRSNDGLSEAIAEGIATAPRVDFATQLRELAAPGRLDCGFAWA